MNVHAERDQLVSRARGGIVFIDIYILVFICTATPIIYTRNTRKEGTNEHGE